jgi:hypothetical protein
MCYKFLVVASSVLSFVCCLAEVDFHDGAPRNLQLGTGVLDRYQVGESTINFQGTTIELVYPLSDLLPDNTLVIQTFSDSDCSVDISDNTYLVPTITYDDNPDPTGEKNREVSVLYTIDPKEIQNHPVWIQESSATAFVSFCTAINLYNGDISDPNSGPMARLDTLVYLQVNFEGGFAAEVPVGPADRLQENAQQLYYVEGFLCDESNLILSTERPMRQGENVKVCVKPTNEALADGIMMRQIDSFTFYREKEDGEKITQTAVTNGVSANKELTSLTCERGSNLCHFETLLKSDFYYKPGMIMGYGEAWLQVSQICMHTPVCFSSQLHQH